MEAGKEDGLNRPHAYVTHKVNCILRQDDKHPVYIFSLTGGELLTIAEISRLSRDNAGKLIGYQRPGVKRHVQDIVTYLNGRDILFPNSIILALSSSVRFTRSRGPEVDDGHAAAGILELPIPRPGQPKPAWVVDGQQRLLALSRCRRKDFPVPVSAFVADEIEIQRDQFRRVNNTHPLPAGLIKQLLPEVSANLPARLGSRKLSALICDWLNRNPASPFFGLNYHAASKTSTKHSGVLVHTAILRMIEESLYSPSGCLFTYRNIATGETDADGICAALIAYWSAVKRVFPDAWGKPPGQSLLMHTVGIRAMGRLMNRVMAWVDCRDPKATELAERELRRVAPVCRWTKGVWVDLNEMPWNELQSSPRDNHVLSNYLLRSYLQAQGRTKYGNETGPTVRTPAGGLRPWAA